jgi:2'-5' RNA ligase
VSVREVLLASWLLRLGRADRLLTDLVMGAFASMLTAARRAMGSREGQPDVTAGSTAASDDWQRSLPAILDALTVTFVDTAQAASGQGGDDSLVERASRYAVEARNRLVTVPQQVFEAVRDVVTQGINEGASIPDLREQILGLLTFDSEAGKAEWAWRAERIARTEVHAAMSAAQYEGHRMLQDLLGRPIQREWLATLGDDRTRPSHVAANGQRVSLDEPYLVGGAALRWPGDPEAPAREVINCRCAEIPIVDDEVYMAPPDVDALAADAAEEAVAGAMIALVPSAADAQRLALGRGLDAEDLHLTLVFLGDATAWPDRAREELLTSVADQRPLMAVEAMAWATAAFNAGSQSECVAYLVGDNDGELSWVHTWALTTAQEVAGMMLAPQHDPWIPHVTMSYGTTDIGGLTELGAVTFDRLRIAFGDQVTDYPLTVDDEDVAAGLATEADAALVAAAGHMPAQLRQSYLAGKVAARIRWGQDGDFGRCVVQARKHGMGTMAEGACAQLHHEATGKWPGSGQSHAAGLEDDVLVPLPGAEGLYVSPAVAAAVTAAVPQSKRDAAEDSGHAMPGGRYPINSAADLAKAIRAVGRAGGSEGTDDDRAEVRRHIIRQAKRLGLADKIPDSWQADGSLTAALLDTGRHLEPAPDTSRSRSPVDPIAAIVAAIPSCPPRGWFERVLDGPTPLTLTADGGIYGHMALWDSCHRGYTDRCVVPPRSQTAYAEYMLGEALCADGSRMPVGKIVLGGGHAGLELARADAVAHYTADAAAHVASVRAWDDEYGIAVAGTLLPSVTADQVRYLLASPLSGDWREVGGHLELVAALAVNAPGYPVPRAMAASSEGALIMETAPAWRVTKPDMVLLDAVADLVLHRMDERGARNELASELHGLAASALGRQVADLRRKR